MIKPIKPNQVNKAKASSFPDYVFAAFNNMITENWDGRQSRFTLNKVANHMNAISDIDRGTLFDKGYFDVEAAYEKEGWKVYFDKPGFCETYDAYYIFTKEK